MNKENNRSAAGLRRSAIAERIRLREEWSALKEIDSQPPNHNVIRKQTNARVTAKKLAPVKELMRAPLNIPTGRLSRGNPRSSDALRGVVALVEVGNESRALPLRAALSALGASVMPTWNPLITHLVWAEGGCRATRARARALACDVVSPLWVEACACAAERLPARAFPAAARASDLPSPATLRHLLKKAEAENIPLVNLLTDSDDKEKVPRLRISSDTDQDTSGDTSRDTSRDTTNDTSRDTSKDTSSDTSKDTSKNITKETTTDIESRVNTAQRRALPKASSISSPPVTKSRRKLFTQKEAEMAGSSDDEGGKSQPRPAISKPCNPKPKRPAQECGRRELARAERMAKRFLAACTGTPHKPASQHTPRIVLTGMSRVERRAVSAAILSLKGRIQKSVTKLTTHVVLGSFQDKEQEPGVTGITSLSQAALAPGDVHKARTVSALCGAARGCRVLRARWALHCAAEKKWLHHSGYEVPHLRKISQKARVERTALGKTRSEYAYDVFCGMRVFVTSAAEQKDAAIELLNLCGAVVQDGGVKHGGIQHGGIEHGQGLTQLDKLLGNTQKRQQTQRTQHALVTQNGEICYGVVQNGGNDYDIKIGIQNGEVSSKWVFDSVAAARMRTTRRYVVKEISSQASQMLEEMANFCIDDC